MPRTIQSIADEIKEKFGPFPYDVEIKVDHLMDNLLVSSKHADLGFCITRKSIADGLHMRHFPASLLGLKRAMANKYFVMAATLWPEMAQTTDDLAKRWHEAFGPIPNQPSTVGSDPVREAEWQQLVVDTALRPGTADSDVNCMDQKPVETDEERKARIWQAVCALAKA
jgi:hypothetical protein